MFEIFCLYGVNCAKCIKIGCLIWAFLFMGGGAVALDQDDVVAARKYGWAMVAFGMAAMFFPDPDTWQGWLEVARRP